MWLYCTGYSGLRFCPYLYIVRHIRERLDAGLDRRYNLAESKILQALRAYKEQYAWDKSLLGSVQDASSAPAALIGSREKQEHTNTALEDFTNGFSSR